MRHAPPCLPALNRYYIIAVAAFNGAEFSAFREDTSSYHKLLDFNITYSVSGRAGLSILRKVSYTSVLCIILLVLLSSGRLLQEPPNLLIMLPSLGVHLHWDPEQPPHWYPAVQVHDLLG